MLAACGLGRHGLASEIGHRFDPHVFRIVSQTAPAGPVVTVDPNVKLTLMMMRVRNGQTHGGIENHGTLKLIRSHVTNNHRSSGFGGGGITNSGGDVYIIKSTVSDNSVTCCGNDGGGVRSDGGSATSN